MRQGMIRRIIIKSNKRIAVKMVFYTSMFTGLFMAYFILMSFNVKTHVEVELQMAQQRIDSLQLALEEQSEVFWGSVQQSVPTIAPIKEEDVKGDISEYGYRIHPIYKVSKFHYGRDFPAEEGTPVFATANGVVEQARIYRYGYGNRVIVDHGMGYKTIYAHLSALDVKTGDTVKRGDTLAYVGSTGVSTGPHLHYEVVHKGKKVNPREYSLYEDIILLALKQ